MILFQKEDLHKIGISDYLVVDLIWKIVVKSEIGEYIRDKMQIPTEEIICEVEAYLSSFSKKPEKVVGPSSVFVNQGMIRGTKHSRSDVAHYLTVQDPESSTLWWISKANGDEIFAIASYANMLKYPEYYGFDYEGG